MAHDVFISYSTKNQDIADDILKALESNDIPCWIATRDIPSGKEWAQSILEAIAGSKVMVVVFSAHSNISVHVMKEVERAIHYNAPIIPFRIENIFPTKSMEYYLSTVNWLDAWQAPVNNHFKLLCDRVQKILNDAEGIGPATNGRAISAKSIKAFDLAYNAEQRESSNPAHAAFWLGSRYLPGFDIFELTRKQNLQERQMVDNALFSDFEKYEKELGLNLGFEKFFNSILEERDHQKEVSFRLAFINKTVALIEPRHGANMAYWWVLGISLSTLWFWTTKAESMNADAVENPKIEHTLNSISTILQLLDLPGTLKDDFNTMRTDPGKSKDPKILKDWLLLWTALIEMYLLIEEYEISRENAEILLEINPELATFVLQRYLRQNPQDESAIFLIGKSSHRSFSGDLSLEPLFRTDPVKILVWSMKKSIQLQPDSEWSKRARILLEKIKT